MHYRGTNQRFIQRLEKMEAVAARLVTRLVSWKRFVAG